MNPQPPKRALSFLRWYCSDRFIDELEGDLTELYLKDHARSPKAARWNFVWAVIRHFRPEFLGFGNRNSINPFDMLSNYVTVLRRNLMRQKLYAGINIAGLSFGLACFILVMLFVHHELSYDQFYKDRDNIYFVYQRQAGNMYLGSDKFGVTPALLPLVMMQEVPAVRYATSVEKNWGLLTLNDVHFYEQGFWADSRFFEVFDLPFVSGNPRKALADENSIILTESLAKRMFGESEDPIGKHVRIFNDRELTVTGVMRDLPDNSTLQYEFVVNLLIKDYYKEETSRSTWKGNNYATYFLLADGADAASVEDKFPGIILQHRDPIAYATYPYKDSYHVLPLTSLHLETGIKIHTGLIGDPKYVYLFLAIAVIVLVIACVNYVNLAMARATTRAREVGLRKTVGAVKTQIVGQFLSESLLITFLALVLALILVYTTLPVFNRIMERHLALDFAANPVLLPALIAIFVVIGIAAGGYPAWVMSSLNAVSVVKGTLKRISGLALQPVLVVGQFTAGIVLIVGSVVVYSQMKYMQEKDLGFDRQHVITINVKDGNLFGKYGALKQEWLSHPAIVAATTSIHLPTNMGSSTNINDDDDISGNELMNIYDFRANYDVLQVFGLELVAGRDFSPEIPSDLTDGYIINETAARALGWTSVEAIGKQFSHEGMETVIGVVRDFHLHSMHLTIQPVMIRLYPEWGNKISIKIRPEDVAETVAYLERTTRKYTNYPFEYRFLDDEFNELYKSETKMAELVLIFTVLSVAIASLGLFGLAAFMTGQRSREIGIRKVMGASVNTILVLLTRNFIGLVLLSFLLAVPVSWLAMNFWLQDFAYRIDVAWWMFASAGALSLVVAAAAVSYQSLSAASINPVHSLRAE